METKVLRLINWKVFFVSFILGIIFITYYSPDRRTIYVYPTPETVGEVQYRDAAGNCFEMQEEKTQCPANKTEIKQIPVQA
jgi:hypothetical protein